MTLANVIETYEHKGDFKEWQPNPPHRVDASPSIYCVSNARSAASTVEPIPTIPSSMLGPSSAIQSPLRIDNAGRRTTDGLPGWAVQYDFISSNAVRAGSIPSEAILNNPLVFLVIGVR